MDLPNIYAHVTRDGQILKSSGEPGEPIFGAGVFLYVPVSSTNWRMSDSFSFDLPPHEDTPIACKILKTANGEAVPELNRYAIYPSYEVRGLKANWGLWGWKFLEPRERVTSGIIPGFWGRIEAQNPTHARGQDTL